MTDEKLEQAAKEYIDQYYKDKSQLDWEKIEKHISALERMAYIEGAKWQADRAKVLVEALELNAEFLLMVYEGRINHDHMLMIKIKNARDQAIEALAKWGEK